MDCVIWVNQQSIGRILLAIVLALSLDVFKNGLRCSCRIRVF